MQRRRWYHALPLCVVERDGERLASDRVKCSVGERCGGIETSGDPQAKTVIEPLILAVDAQPKKRLIGIERERDRTS